MATPQQTTEATGASDGDQRVSAFRPRPSTDAARPPISRPNDLSGYERSREPDDYRHRMVVNAAAGLFTIALIGFGIWLAMSIADLRKTTDCLLVGRRDCAVI